MKKIFLGAALAVGTLGFAQSFGVKGGGNMSTVAGLEDIDTEYKFGWNAGIFMNIPLSESFSLQPEALYNTLGTKAKFSDNTDNDVTWKLDYVTVPVMVQYNATPKFYLEAGPQFGVLVSSKEKVGSETSESNIEDMNHFDFGAAAGLGYWITPNLGVNARYVAGFSDIMRGNGSNKDVRNNNIQVGLSYKFK